MRKYIYLLAMSLCLGLVGCGDDEVVPPVSSEVNPNNSGESDKAKTICPDGNHPHAIDLGLPSGTKWCCCNVGASSPEDYGGYYAWGETKVKSVYTKDTYAYYSSDNYDYIGSNISATEYDVARVRMGSPWRMPSKAELKEIIDNCSRQWTALNDVYGILVIGKNGSKIFLPAAGLWGDVLYDAGSAGCYLSSSLGNEWGVYYLTFNYSLWSDYQPWQRYMGYSVRATSTR